MLQQAQKSISGKLQQSIMTLLLLATFPTQISHKTLHDVKNLKGA